MRNPGLPSEVQGFIVSNQQNGEFCVMSNVITATERFKSSLPATYIVAAKHVHRRSTGGASDPSRGDGCEIWQSGAGHAGDGRGTTKAVLRRVWRGSAAA